MNKRAADPLTDAVLDIIRNLTGKDFDYELSRFCIYILTAIGAVLLLAYYL